MRLAAVPLCAVLVGAPALAAPVRVAVVNARVELRYADTYANYRDKMFALLDATHPRRAELVQADVADVASQLRPRDPAAPDALVLFPEDVGLAAGLIGSRGAAARAVAVATGGSTTAFFLLTVAYQPQVEYYQQRYPGLSGLGYLFLAATDTYYRAFYETFRDLAREYGVHVAASVNVAPARRLEAADDPELVALLRDPDEPGRPYAYEAVEGRPVNTLFVFAPDGEVLVLDAQGHTVRAPSQTGGVLRGSLDKAYLTEIEQDPLGLLSGAVRNLDVLETPVGRLAAVTSKDAWMIDVNDRYDAKHPQLVIQPEAFDQWAFNLAPWAPDGFKAGGFAQVQRNPSFLLNLTPCLLGNLFDVTFDGQGAVIGKRHKRVASELVTSPRWIGQNPDGGFVAVAPWIADDPVLEEPDLPLAARRAALVAAGTPLRPGSGVACPAPNAAGSCENGYRESVLITDLSLPDAPPARTPGPVEPTAFGAAVFPFAPAASATRLDSRARSAGLRARTRTARNDTATEGRATGEQRHPHLAAHDGHVYVVWQDGRDGFENVYLGISDDHGETFRAQRVSDNPAGSVVELRPDVALSPDGRVLAVVWQELCEGRNDDCGRIQLARFDAAGTKLGSDVRVDRGADDAGKWNPAVALDGGGHPLVAWVDERDRSPGGLPLEHIYFSRGLRGERMSRNVRVDRGAPNPFATELDNKWAPTVAWQPRSVFVAWTDFRDYQWDIYLARSPNGVAFGRNVRVDDADERERIHDHPALAVDGRGTLHAVWADRRRQDPDTDIRAAHSRDGRRFSASLAVDRAEQDLNPDRDTPSNQWFPSLAAAGDEVVAVWQDNRLGDNDIFFAESHDGGATFAPDERLDDSGTDPSDQYRPDVAMDVTDGSVYATWEDERFGTSTIAVARRVP